MDLGKGKIILEKVGEMRWSGDSIDRGRVGKGRLEMVRGVVTGWKILKDEG